MGPNEAELKHYINKKLEANSDADPEVLGDYVLALLKADALQPVSKRLYVSNLTDFLSDNTEAFVDDLFLAISTSSFDPNQTTPSSKETIYSPAVRSSLRRVKPQHESRKRAYHDWDGDGNENGHIASYSGEDRPTKHARRGGRGHDYRAGRHFGASQQHGMPRLPTLPPGMPALDTDGAMAALLAMQQAIGLIPGIPDGLSRPDGPPFNLVLPEPRCKDYDTKGFCAAGASCPYEHGNDPYVIPFDSSEYDPNNAALLTMAPNRDGYVDAGGNNRSRGHTRARGRGRGSGALRSGPRRAQYSLSRPSYDPSITAIVVERIPDDKCDEDSVRAFFSAFGGIRTISIHPEDNLAIVSFNFHHEARAAYRSSKAIFDNRFVKVYWHKGEQMSGPPQKQGDLADGRLSGADIDMEEAEEVDLDEIAKRQEEAQRKHEEAKQNREAAEKKRQDLSAKLHAMDAERRKIADAIAKRIGNALSPDAESSSDDKPAESEQTRVLRAQLAKLEAEAKSLGIDPEATTNGHEQYPSHRSRGGYRGRGRGGASYPSYRGGWARGGGAVMRLDNRPKTVAVTFSEGQYDSHDEALRQFLLFNSLEPASLHKHPMQDDVALITFQHRYEGENFMQAAVNSQIHRIGKVEFSWYSPRDKIPNAPGEHAENADVVRGSISISSDPLDAPAEEEDLDRWN